MSWNLRKNLFEWFSCLFFLFVCVYLDILAVLVWDLLALFPMCVSHRALLLIGGGAFLLALGSAHLKQQF